MYRETISKIVFFTILFTALSLFSLVPLLPASQAQTPDYDRINEVASNLNCPTCSGINLADCRTQTCAQWREQIGDLLAKGYSDQQVLDYFVTQYGPQVLQQPPKSGFTATLWFLPVVAILIGGVLLFFTMRKWSQKETAPVAAPPTPAAQTPDTTSATADDYLSQVEQDLGLD